MKKLLIQMWNSVLFKHKKYTLNRIFETNRETIGYFIVEGKVYFTLELPFRNNERKVSSIPAGLYRVVKRKSQAHGQHFHLLDVPNRDLILIHAGNFYDNTEGCIIVGKGISDINGDGELDVTSSKQAMAELNSLLPDIFLLDIK